MADAQPNATDPSVTNGSTNPAPAQGKLDIPKGLFVQCPSCQATVGPFIRVAPIRGDNRWAARHRRITVRRRHHLFHRAGAKNYEIASLHARLALTASRDYAASDKLGEGQLSTQPGGLVLLP